MRRTFFVVVFTFIALTLATARQLTPAEALNRIKQNITAGRSMANGSLQDECSYNLAYTSAKGDTVTYYAFNRTNGCGFVILSADDCMPAILMESDQTGNFCSDSIPDGMRWWLSQYDKAVTRYAAEGRSYTPLTTYPEITPLLEIGGKKTAWYQMTPYNDQCPSYNGERAYTGCVATAMAQLMRFYEYPTTGIGKKSYDFNFNYVADNITQNIPMKDSTDFSAHQYRWSDMLDTYTKTDDVPNYTEQQSDAVATLMHDCGVASSIIYGNNSTGGVLRNAIRGMVDNFGYDASIVNVYRNIYTDEQWEHKVYSELQAGRPMLYQGFDFSHGAHAFVCDGYKDGRYHMNWGWNGARNCYVLLVSSDTESALTPLKENDSQIDYIFGYNQSATFSNMPDKGGVLNPDCKLATTGACYTYTHDENGRYLDPTEYNRSQLLYLSGSFINLCYRPRTYAVGIKLANDDITYFLPYTEQEVDGNSIGNLKVPLTDIQDGTYTVTPVYKDLTAGDTEWIVIPMSASQPSSKITVKGDYPTSVEDIKSGTVCKPEGGVTKILKNRQVIIRRDKMEYDLSGKQPS